MDHHVALVTGAGGAIGAEIAMQLSIDGYRVVCADQDEVAAAATATRIGGVAFRCDVRAVTDIQNLKLALDEGFGHVGTLVNVAGVFFTHRIPELSEADWDVIIDVNLKGTFLMCKTFLPDMITKHAGCIINIGSTAGLHGSRDRAAYCASKAGVILFSRALALDHGRDGVRINCICPGLIDTPMVGWLTQDQVAFSAWQASVPAQRIGSPVDIASAVSYLASPHASYVHGATLVVDGGETA